MLCKYVTRDASGWTIILDCCFIIRFLLPEISFSTLPIATPSLSLKAVSLQFWKWNNIICIMFSLHLSCLIKKGKHMKVVNLFCCPNGTIWVEIEIDMGMAIKPHCSRRLEQGRDCRSRDRSYANSLVDGFPIAGAGFPWSLSASASRTRQKWLWWVWKLRVRDRPIKFLQYT